MQEYSDYSPQYYTVQIPHLLRTYLDTVPWGVLLDAGCGDGSLLYALKKKEYFNTKKFYAIDISPKSIALVKRIDPNIHASVDSVEIMQSITTNSIDFLSSSMVIEHVDDKKMLNAVDRVLRNNGFLYLETVCKNRYGWYFRRRKGRWVMDVTHLREYQKDSELLSLINPNTYIIRESKKTLLWFPIADAIMRRLGIRQRTVFIENNLLRAVRRISLPIIGYYRWELIVQKVPQNL